MPSWAQKQFGTFVKRMLVGIKQRWFCQGQRDFLYGHLWMFFLPASHQNVTRPNLHLAVFCLYWLQYSVNFVIYAARNQQV